MTSPAIRYIHAHASATCDIMLSARTYMYLHPNFCATTCNRSDCRLAKYAEMAIVSVLLRVGDRKKVVQLPSDCADHYAFLCQTVLEWTGEIVYFLERFDSDWEDWIELEKGFQASDKDRIKAVLSAPLKQQKVQK